MTIEPLITTIIEIAATLAFAISGVIEAVRKHMDVVGIFAIAFVTAFGGGTVRDILLNRRPLFWVQHHEYVWMVLALVVIAPPLLRWGRYQPTQWLMEATDALGLGLFSVSGASMAQAAGMPLIVVLIMGVITGVLGGVLRDVICDQIPIVFRSRSPYALCSLAGCLVYWMLHSAGAEPWLELSVGAGIATGLRLLTAGWGWQIPEWPDKKTDKPGA